MSTKNIRCVANLLDKLSEENEYDLADKLLCIVNDTNKDSKTRAVPYIRHEDIRNMEDIISCLQSFEATAREIYLGMATVSARVEPLAPESYPRYDKALNLFQEQIVNNSCEYNNLFIEMFTKNPFDI